MDGLGGQGSQKVAAEERQGWFGLRWEKDQEGRAEACAVPQLGWISFFV